MKDKCNYYKLQKEKIIQLVRQIKLKKRFWLFLILAIVLPVILLEIFTFSAVRYQFQLRNFKTMQQELDSYNSLINNKLHEFSSVGTYIATNMYTIKMMNRNVNDWELEDYIQMSNYYRSLEDWTGSLEGFITVEVISKDGLIIEKPYQYINENLEESNIYKTIMEDSERQMWLGAYPLEYKERYLPWPSLKEYQYPLIVSTKVKSSYSSEYLGCVNLYIKQSLVRKLIENVLNYSGDNNSCFTENNIFYIDDCGKIVFHNDINKIGDNIERNLKEKLDSYDITDSKAKIICLDRKDKKIVFSSVSELTGMTMVGLVDYDEFYRGLNSIFQYALFFTTIIVGFMAVILWLYFASIQNPISMLISGIRQVEENNLTVVVKDEGKDELSDLIETFNQMITQIASLMEQKISLEQKKKEADLKVLEEQINPHFLYNTLDMINWIAYERGDEKICEIIESLSDFYRLGLNSGESIYTVRQEIQHVKAYMKIQKERFHGMVNCYFDVQQEVCSCAVVKIILQPLVENAIVHGILPMKKPGNIWISVYKDKDEVVLSVLDDGVGFKEKQIKKMRSDGYGLYNVDERIKMYFGSSYGLFLENGEDGKGAKVTIRIPMIVRDEINENFDS